MAKARGRKKPGLANAAIKAITKTVLYTPLTHIQTNNLVPADLDITDCIFLERF